MGHAVRRSRPRSRTVPLRGRIVQHHRHPRLGAAEGRRRDRPSCRSTRAPPSRPGARPGAGLRARPSVPATTTSGSARGRAPGPPRRRPPRPAPSATGGGAGAGGRTSVTPIRSKRRTSNPSGGSISGAACTTVSAVRDRISSSSAQRGQDSTWDSTRARSRPVRTPSASSASSFPYCLTAPLPHVIAHRVALLSPARRPPATGSAPS